MRLLASVLGLLAVVTLAGLVRAEEPGAKPAGKPGVIAGKITQLELQAPKPHIVLKVKGQDTEVAVDDKTTVVIEGQAATLSDLKVGQKVIVTPATGTATKIEVPKKPAPKAEGEKPKTDAGQTHEKH